MVELLEAEGITKSFAGVVALDQVSLTLRAGSVHAVVGENGAGKSTLMKVIAGVHKQTSGTLRLNGQEVSWTSVENAQENGVSTIFQEFILLPNLSVAENLFLGHEPRTRLGLLDRRKMRDEGAAALDRLGLDIDPDRLTSTLSVAEQQMVEITKGVMRDADIFVFDEPTAALGDAEAQRLFELIRTLRDNRKGVLYVSHRLPEIFVLADEVTVLKDSAFVGNYPIAELTSESLVKAMVGRSLDDLFPARSSRDPDASETAITLQDVRLEGMPGVSNLEVRRGEIVGLAGLEGQGQIGITRAIYGDRALAGGRILLNGEPVHYHGPAGAIGAGIGLVPEDRKAEGLFADLAVDDNILVGKLGRVALWRPAWRDAKAVRDQIDSLRIRLTSPRQQIKGLSGGNQQKALVARWLIRGVDVLICEEPTRGVDIGAKSEIYRVLRELAESGVAILITSRELPELLGLCDRLVVLRDGGTVGEYPAEDATEDRVMHTAIYGEQA